LLKKLEYYASSPAALTQFEEGGLIAFVDSFEGALKYFLVDDHTTPYTPSVV
jgi:hypothetical protein